MLTEPQKGRNGSVYLSGSFHTYVDGRTASAAAKMQPTICAQNKVYCAIFVLQNEYERVNDRIFLHLTEAAIRNFLNFFQNTLILAI